MDSELLEIRTEGEPVVVVIDTPPPVAYRTAFEFFGGIFLFMVVFVVVIALIAVLAVVAVVIAMIYLVRQIVIGARLDRRIAARIRALRAQ